MQVETTRNRDTDMQVGGGGRNRDADTAIKRWKPPEKLMQANIISPPWH